MECPGKPWKLTFVVHVPVVLPDGVVVRAGRWPDGKVGGHAAHHRPLRLWEGNPAGRGSDGAPRAKRPEGRAVQVVDGTDQRGHLDGTDFLSVSFQARLEVPEHGSRTGSTGTGPLPPAVQEASASLKVLGYPLESWTQTGFFFFC